MGAGTWVQSRGRREGEIPQHRVEILAGSHPSSSGAVLSIDRMEHPSPTRGTRRYPRYHSNLFRGQDAWDPHTHVLLSSQAPRPSPAEGERSPLGRVPFPCPTPVLCKRSGEGLAGGSLFTQTYSGTWGPESKAQRPRKLPGHGVKDLSVAALVPSPAHTHTSTTEPVCYNY